MKFATAVFALLGAAQADYQSNSDGTQISFDPNKRYTFYRSTSWEHCKASQYATL